MFGNRPSLFNTSNTSFGGSTGIGFGANATSTPFGAGATGTAFGATNTFGAQPAQTGGLFGAATNTAAGTGGLFGGGTSVFGQPAQQQQQTAFTFGAATATVASTAQPAAGGGLFGATAPTAFGTAQPQQSALFGAGTTNTFGATAAQSANTGMFGGGTSGGFLTASASGTAGSGTTVKFVPITGTDVVMKGGAQSSVTTKLQCITGMKEYEAKSLEELRMEDYVANRKGPQQGAVGFGFGASVATTQSTAGFSSFGAAKPATQTFGGFGAGATGTGLFGSTQQPTQQSVGSSLFGGTTSFGAAKPLFGTATTTVASTPFGGLSTAGAGSTLFGQANQNKSIFGATATAQPSGLFGATQPTATPAFGTGAFGTATNTAFGSTATSTGGLFGAAKPTAFGQPTSGLFGQATSQPTTGFAFGQAQPQQATLGTGTGGLFGAKPATATTGFGFGATSTSTPFGFNTGAQTGFGNTGGLLGGGSLTFGTAQNKPAVSGPSLFGGTSSFGTTGFNFGTANTGQTGLGTGFSGFGTTVASGQAAVDATAAAVAQQNQQQLLQLTSSPYGDSPLFRNLRKDATKREDLLKPTSPAAQKAALANGSQFKVGNRPLAKIKPKPLLAGSASGKGQLFDGLEEDEAAFEGETFVPRRSVRKLVIKNSNKSNISRSSGSPPSFLSVPAREGVDNNRDRLSNERPSGSGINGQGSGQHSDGIRQTAGGHLPGSTNFDDTIGELNVRNRAGYRDDFRTRDGVVLGNDQDTNLDFSHDPLGRQPFSGGHDSSSEPDDQASSISESDQPPHPCGVVLRRHGYFTLPALEELLPEADGRCQVENFVVAREGYGNVLFPGVTDIAGMNLDEIVHFRRKEIDVYPNDDNKPPIGQGLNKRAQVTLDFVWPRDKTTGKSIKDFQRLKDMGYTEYLERASNKIGAKFIEYRSETGSWVFEVKHFSKYGLPDDSDDEDAIVSVPKMPPVLPPGRVPIQPLHDQQRVVSVDDSATATVQQAEKFQSAAAANVDLEPKRRGLGGCIIVDEDDSEMPDITREKFPAVSAYDDVEDDEMLTDMVPGSHHIARTLAVTADQIQIQKASFFADDDGDEYGGFGQRDWSGFGAASQLKQQSASAFGGTSSPWSQKSVVKPAGCMFVGGGDTKQQQQQQQQRGKSAAADPTARPQTPQEFEMRPLKMPSMHFPSNDQHKLIPSGLDRSKSVPRPVVGTRIQRSIVPLDRSLLLGRHSMIVDAGLMQSRRFRVGWAPSWVMSHLTRMSEEEKADLSMSVGYSILMDSQSILAARKSLNVSDYRLTLERVLPFSVQSTQDIAVIRNTLVSRLEVQLENSNSEMEYGCPVFTADDGNSLLQGYVKQSHDEPVDSDSTVSASAVWELCYALWGRLEGAVSAFDNRSVDERNYVTQQARREALSCWLTDCTADIILKEVQQAKAKNRDSAACVFSFLSGRMIEEACDHAVGVGDLRLALLVSQAIGSEDLRHLMVKQLGSWADTQMDQFITADRLRVFALLAGTPVWESSSQNINTCASLDWRRCFALHLWYHCLPTATIMDAVRAYDQSYACSDEASRYAAPPLPLYLEKQGAEVNSDECAQDVCYQLLKLFCDRTRSLHILLNPPSITDNDLDYSLSWHLMVTLFSLDYNHLDMSHHASICVSYASQLEALGLWHWAVFVLLHLQEPQNRISAVQQLIERHVTLSDPAEVEKEQFLVKSLHVPVEWIHVAKSLRAKSEGNRIAEAWHLLRARKWNQAHSLIVKHIAPEAVVNGNEQVMCSTFLQPMSTPEISAQVKDWSTGGGLFLDYGDMLRNFHGFNQGTLQSDVDLEALHVKSVSVAGRINKLQCRTAVDSVCQATMSKNVAKVMTSLMSFKRDSSQHQALLDAMTSHVGSLQLPEDYALEALGHVSHSLLRSLTISY